MPLRLIVGPANSAKAGEVLGSYRAVLARDPLLVVPTADDVEHYTRELSPVLGARVETFDDLVAEIGRRAQLHVTVATGVQREQLLAWAVRETPLRALARSAESPGFVSALGRLVAELHRELVEPKRLARALPEGYGREVAALYGTYRRGLERAGRMDAELRAWRALDALRGAPSRWGDTPVFLYGFDDLTTLQRDAVDTLARVAGVQVTLSLPYEAGRVAFAGRATTFEELRPIATELVELPERADYYAHPALHELERGLFEAPGAAPLDPGGAVRLLEAGGERAEVELVGAEVLDLLAEGVPAEQVAVVFRSPARAAPLVEQVFGALGIPFTMHRSIPLRDTALGRGLLALLRSALPGGTAEDVLAYLRTPGRLQVPELADRLEAALRRAGVRDAPGALERWQELAGWPLEEIDRVADAARAGPRPLLAALGRAAGRLLAGSHRRRAELLTEPELPDARALRAVRLALTELDALAEAAPWAAPAPAALLGSLADLEVRLGGPPRAGAVHVAGPLDIRARRYRAVLLCGLQEGELPAAGRPEPFLSDAARWAANTAGGLRLPLHEDRLAEERYLFYAVASRPEERLVLSCRVCDEEGTAVAPSSFLEEVRALFGERLDDRRRARLLAEVTWPPESAPTEAERARSEAARGPRAEPPPIAPLRETLALASVRDRVVSPGGLEAWAACPARWLVERHLSPEPLEPDAEPLARGSLAHAVLEATLQGLHAHTGSARLQAANLPEARELARAALEERCGALPLSRHEPTARASLRRLLRELERYLAWEAEAGGAWEPRHLELRFGFDDGGLPPLVLGDGAVRIHGVIDRVDVDPTERFALVRDYKSSLVYPVATWERDVRLQVALYMLAVRRLLGLEVVGGIYQPLRGRDLRPRGLVRGGVGEVALGQGAVVETDVKDDEAFEERLAWAERHGLEVAAELHAGALAPRPERCYSSRGCQYPGICRSGAAA